MSIYEIQTQLFRTSFTEPLSYPNYNWHKTVDSKHWPSDSSSRLTAVTLLLLLFRHSVKSLNAQDKRLATSPWLVTRLHLSHAIAVRLRVRKSCYPHTGNGGHSWCLSSSLSLSVGFSIQDEAMDVARSAPQGAHYHAGVIYLLPLLGIKKGATALWNSEINLHQLGSWSTVFLPRWATHPCILYQVYAACGASDVASSSLGWACWRDPKNVATAACVYPDNLTPNHLSDWKQRQVWCGKSTHFAVSNATAVVLWHMEASTQVGEFHSLTLWRQISIEDKSA